MIPAPQRTAIRATTKALLEAYLEREMPGVQVPVLAGQDWAIGPEELPALLLDVRGEQWTAIVGSAEPAFQVNLSVVVRARQVVLSQAEDAAHGADHGPEADRIQDAWLGLIEDALLQEPAFVALSDRITGLRLDTQTVSEAEQTIAEAGIAIALQFEVTCPPRIEGRLNEMRVRIDAIDPADLAGTYPPAPPFPDAAPAPRRQGPDGRAEMDLDIVFPPTIP